MAGTHAFGTKMYKMSGTNSTAISNLTNLNGISAEGDDIDVTDHDDTDGWREFIPGLVDGGDVELEMHWVKSAIQIIDGLWRTTNTYKIVFPDSSSWSFVGYLKAGFDSENPVDDKMAAGCTFKVSGRPTFATS